MREFFNPWRRKIGAVTLVMACVFMAGWVRSRTTCDFMSFFSSDRRALHDLSSTRMGLMYIRTDQDFTGQTKSITFATRTWNLPPDTDYLSGAEMNWSIDSCGFRFGDNFHRSPQAISGITAWIIPYYVIVLPLTALSAFLLLFKPRQSTPKMTPGINDWNKSNINDSPSCFPRIN